MMNIKKSTTIGSALTRARTAVSDACQASPTSRYLPLLLSTLEALIISLPGETKRLQVLSVTFGVTHISARRADGSCLPLWERAASLLGAHQTGLSLTPTSPLCPVLSVLHCGFWTRKQVSPIA